MALKNYNNLLASGSFYSKDTKDDQILSIVGLCQNLVYDSNKLSDKSNTSNSYSTKVDPAYIRYLPPWMLEEPKCVVGNKNKDGK